jgi:hypothetical protein
LIIKWSLPNCTPPHVPFPGVKKKDVIANYKINTKYVESSHVGVYIMIFKREREKLVSMKGIIKKNIQIF